MVVLTEKGLFCGAGNFYIDPHRRVETALVTHAHSDHARRGMKYYYCVASGKDLLQHRMGPQADIRTVQYGEIQRFGDVNVSFHPAGHILGSAQIRLERHGEVWVVSGDYKREADPTCEPFEVVPCDTFITEATFGEPHYQWGETANTDPGLEIFKWWELNRAEDLNSIIYAYSLGKTQRILGELYKHTQQPVYVYGEAHPLTEHYRTAQVPLVPTRRLESLGPEEILRGELIVTPHSINQSPWMTHADRRLGRYVSAFASGWMQSGAFGMGRHYDRGFVMSDHADFPALVRTVKETGARRVRVLHAREGRGLIRHLQKLGIDAAAMIPHQPVVDRPLSPVQIELFPRPHSSL